MDNPPNLQSLNELLVFELANAVGKPENNLVRNLIRLLLGRAVRTFSQLALDLDHEIGEGGVAAGASFVLPRFAAGSEVQGENLIPAEGPLVIAANHPGSFDSIAISAHVSRPDYKVIIGDIPFFQNLLNIRKSAIFAPAVDDLPGRMRVVRECVRHLHNGGSLLIFARGAIEPDPSFMPEPDAEFHLWSRSLEIFLRHVPEACVLVTIVSGVISKRAFRHPITLFRKRRPDKQRLAFMYQMMSQMVYGQETFALRPHVTFGELVYGHSHSNVLSKVETAARRTLERHMKWAT